MLSDSDEKGENRDAASTTSSGEKNDDQRRLDNPEGIPVEDNNNINSSSSGDEAVSEFSSQAQQPSRDDDDMVSVGDVGSGAVQPEGGDSSTAAGPTSVRGRLEERLQAAEAENDKLRLAAAEKGAGGQPVDGSGGKELEMLRSQVEAARSDKLLLLPTVLPIKRLPVYFVYFSPPFTSFNYYQYFLPGFSQLHT